MSQKVNPVSNKIGQIQIWNYEISKYGKSFKNYIKFYRFYFYFTDYINRLCMQQEILIKDISIVQFFQKININISIFFPKKKNTFLNLKKAQIYKTIYNWMDFSITLAFYKNLHIGSSSFLVSNYITYLFFQKGNTPKKILQFIFKVLKAQLKYTQIKYTITGLKLIQLKGFKIEVSGCFESSRSQMSKTIKCNFGISSLNKLNGYIDFSKLTTFTKFGSCGFKIWLFYEFK